MVFLLFLAVSCSVLERHHKDNNVNNSAGLAERK